MVGGVHVIGSPFRVVGQYSKVKYASEGEIAGQHSKVKYTAEGEIAHSPFSSPINTPDRLRKPKADETKSSPATGSGTKYGAYKEKLSPQLRNAGRRKSDAMLTKAVMPDMALLRRIHHTD